MRFPSSLAYRDAGCEPQPLPTEVVREMMSFLACKPVGDDLAPLFLDDLHLDGADSGAVTWRDEIPAEVRADSPVVVIGCGESGIVAGIRLAQAGLPFTIVEKGPGPGGTWRDNRYPARASMSAVTTTAIRSNRPTTGRSTSAVSPSSRRTSRGCSTSTGCDRTAASTPR